MDLKQILTQSFATYAGMTIVDRAITDARDCLKPSARQAMYAQFLKKVIHSKPFQKSMVSVAVGMEYFYTHGDTSLYSLLMRMGKPYIYRYPLEEVQGTYGTIVESDNQAAARYTEMRLSALSSYLFEDIDKDTIATWFNNYDDTKQYPAILPSKGFYNIVNGTSGIATAIASSIPQFNLREVNEAMIKLLWNPDISFDEIYCAPDFATGAILLNENEVKESLQNGTGKACKLRSMIEYDEANNCLVVKEIPFGVYTMTIREQLETLINNHPDCGIERFLDSSSDTPLIKIFLQKKANVNQVLQLLYKETFLQYHYSINMTMLENGKVPKIFGWRQALLAHLTHEEEVYRNGYNFDLKKLYERLHIIEGILIALANIDEVIAIIKKSSNSTTAAIALTARFNFTSTQNKAILDMKLSKLAHLESVAYETEKKELLQEIEGINTILGNPTLLKKEIEKGLRMVANKFGDDRRTVIVNIEDSDDTIPTEKKMLYINLTNQNNLYVYEKSSLMIQRKGGVGQKIKLNPNEYIIDSFLNTKADTMLLFSEQGKLYSLDITSIPLNQKTSIFDLLNITENIMKITSADYIKQSPYILFITKQGMIKKSELDEYNIKRSGGIIALKLREDDSLVSILFVNQESIALLSKLGHLLLIDQTEINSVGRVAQGVQGMKLEEGDEVVMARTLSNQEEIVTVTNDGYVKRTVLDEFNITGRNTKGSKVHKVTDNYLVDFELIKDEKNLTLVAKTALMLFPLEEVPITSKNTLGSRSIKLKDSNTIIGILKS